MNGSGNTLKCECGFELNIDEHYQFNENEYGLKNIHDYYKWMKMEETKYIDSLDDDSIVIEEEVDVNKISFKGEKYDVHGTGVCTMTKDTFSFKGKFGDEEVSFTHTHKSLQALAFSVNEEYECYNDGILYYFYPKENRASCTRVALLYDILDEKYNNKN